MSVVHAIPVAGTRKRIQLRHNVRGSLVTLDLPSARVLAVEILEAADAAEVEEEVQES